MKLGFLFWLLFCSKFKVLSNIREVCGIIKKATASVPRGRIHSEGSQQFFNPSITKGANDIIKIFTRKLNIKINSKEQKAISKQAAQPRQEPNTSQENCGTTQDTEVNWSNEGEMQNVDFSVLSRHQLSKTNMTGTLWLFSLKSYKKKSNKEESQLLWWKCNLAVTLYSKMAESCPCHDTLLMEGSSSLREKIFKWIKNDSTGWCFGLSNAGKHGKSVSAP